MDINLPVYDGYYLCREIRKKSQIPIIVVTSRDSELDELMSMNLGTDEPTVSKCTVYVNKGTYFGGMTYAFSEIMEVTSIEIVITTGKMQSTVPVCDVSVILMKEKCAIRTKT